MKFQPVVWPYSCRPICFAGLCNSVCRFAIFIHLRCSFSKFPLVAWPCEFAGFHANHVSVDFLNRIWYSYFARLTVHWSDWSVCFARWLLHECFVIEGVCPYTVIDRHGRNTTFSVRLIIVFHSYAIFHRYHCPFLDITKMHLFPSPHFSSGIILNTRVFSRS